MKVFITVLIAVTAVLGTGIFLLTREPSGEAAPSSVSVPSSEQIVRQEALAPTLTLGGELLSPGFTARGEVAARGSFPTRPEAPW